ncbi:type II secretion system minor pseudopilin GspH [Pseudomonas sp. R5(2019)]|uniref:type II secretion system minor pseudopilin GspH n=1 Tax=Pseudomonas sp. R5(2019) TaxID=2697566 RepID=UPI001412C505|nr:type II secretion system minor pseudopilin GspH [Pseudomonas sp. R5(2019)]
MRHARGFTLLELMVVLMIVGLMSSLSVAWLDDGQAQSRRALEQLASDAATQAARARHEGRVLGLRWNGKAPEFVSLQRQGNTSYWRAERPGGATWPAQLRPDWPVSAQPRVVFTPWGVERPATVTWHWADGQARWRWGRDGRLDIAGSP